jgi:hypothetical protein
MPAGCATRAAQLGGPRWDPLGRHAADRLHLSDKAQGYCQLPPGMQLTLLGSVCAAVRAHHALCGMGQQCRA